MIDASTETGSLAYYDSTSLLNTASITQFEVYRLSAMNDTFTGGYRNDYTIYGMGGDDTINCTGQTEVIGFSGSGSTTASIFANMGTDTINGFTSGQDKIYLDSAVFGAGVNKVSDDSTFGGDLGVTGGAVFIYENGGNFELWYTTDASDATTDNSYQFAESSTAIATADIEVVSS